MNKTRFRLTPMDAGLILGVLIASGIIWTLDQKAKAASPSQAEEKTARFAFDQDPKELKERIQENPSLLRRFQIVSVGIFFLALGSVFCFLRLVWSVFTGRSFGPRLGSPAPPPWGLRQIIRLVLILTLLSEGLLLAALALKAIWKPPWLDRHTLSLASTLALDVAVLGVGCHLFLRKREVDSSRLFRGLQFGVQSYLTFLPILVLLLFLITVGMQIFKMEPSPQPVFTMYLTEKRAGVVGWLLLLAALAGPVAEETFFRGLLYGALRIRIGVVRGLFLSSLLFAGLHAHLVSFLPIFALGLLFGWVYERTGTLLVPMALHIFHNAGMLIVASLFKSLVVAS